MIKVLRVDDRLLHGQVAVAWTQYFQVDVILIANNEVIQNKNMQVAFQLATPPGVTLSMKSLEGAIKVINNPKHANRQIMVITKNLEDAKYLCKKTNGEIKEILLGGLRAGENKVQIDNNSYMDSNDVNHIKELEQAHHIYLQCDPTSKKLSTEEIYKIFEKRGK